jgi:hypothetical protein
MLSDRMLRKYPATFNLKLAGDFHEHIRFLPSSFSLRLLYFGNATKVN